MYRTHISPFSFSEDQGTTHIHVCPHRSCTRSHMTRWAWCSPPSQVLPTSIPRRRWTTKEWSAWGSSMKLLLTLTRLDCRASGALKSSSFQRAWDAITTVNAFHLLSPDVFAFTLNCFLIVFYEHLSILEGICLLGRGEEINCWLTTQLLKH